MTKIQTVTVHCQNDSCYKSYFMDLVSPHAGEKAVGKCPYCKERTEFEVNLVPQAVNQSLILPTTEEAE